MKKNKSHSFLKRVVTLCLIMMCIITIGVLILAWHSNEQLSNSTVAALVGAWCGELLMSLLKRNNDTKKELEEIGKEIEDFNASSDSESNSSYQDQI